MQVWLDVAAISRYAFLNFGSGGKNIAKHWFGLFNFIKSQAAVTDGRKSNATPAQSPNVSSHTSMTSRLSIISILALCLTVTCTSKNSSEPDFDKAVLRQIFPALLDSMYVEIKFSMTPPKITEVVDSITGKKELQPVAKGTTDRELISNDLSLFDRDSIYITIVLSDSIHALANEELEIFQLKYSLSKNLLSNSDFKKSYLLPLNDLNARNCFKLKLSSEYKPTNNDPLMLLRQLKELSFSRIIFDADKTHGMLTGEYVCGGLCGNGYRIFIKKVHEKWIVDYIELAWIA